VLYKQAWETYFQEGASNIDLKYWENNLVHWENHAGYDVDGTVQPKRYYAVDLHKKFYFDGSGEVLDHDIE
jgi:hypothetical protein